jgi:hypothetical protein
LVFFIVKQKECVKMLPYAGGAMLFFLLAFADWVLFNQGPPPQFMGADADPKMKEALTEAIRKAEATRDAETKTAAAKEGPPPQFMGADVDPKMKEALAEAIRKAETTNIEL